MCGALGIAWDPGMLSWPGGRRETDGVWAPDWWGGGGGGRRARTPPPPPPPPPPPRGRGGEAPGGA
ncbi:hypothetical protein AB0367_27375, partial [Dactylosporangium sp. NPDC051484]